MPDMSDEWYAIAILCLSGTVCSTHYTALQKKTMQSTSEINPVSM